jgi:hypothetical protein
MVIKGTGRAADGPGKYLAKGQELLFEKHFYVTGWGNANSSAH